MNPYNMYLVGMIRYSDMYECRLHCSAQSEGEAIKLIRAATWKSGYNEYYIIEEDDE